MGQSIDSMGFIEEKTAGLVSSRTAILMGLLMAPIAVYTIAGSVAVWQLGWMRWLWWLAPIAWTVAWLIAQVWPASPLPGLDLSKPQYWTPRDDEAESVIRRFQEGVDQYTTDQLTDPQFYLSQAQEIAHELARHYRPGTADPISERTLPEILAACRLVADDLEDLLLTSVPGSRMLTVNQWRKLSETPRFVRQATKAFWATKILLNPLNLAQWGTSRVTNDKVTTNLQSELLSALYVRFVKQLGYYLIEMNSGRLRAGADAYRSAFGQLRKPDGHYRNRSKVQEFDDLSQPAQKPAGLLDPAEGDRSEDQSDTPAQAKSGPASHPVKVAFMGESGVGKSTLIRMLLNQPISDSKALSVASDQSPTRSVEVFELSDPKSGLEIHLLDTPGYESNSSGKKLGKPIRFAVESANAIFLVLDAETESWTADKELLEGIEESYRTRENLRPPKVIAVFSYSAGSVSESVDEQNEDSISGSLDTVIMRAKAQFQQLIDDFVPQPLSRHCDPAKFRTSFWEVLSRHLDAAHFSAVLAAFETSLEKGKYRLLLSQAKASGKKLISSWFRKD